jgi:hypothetical protein
VDAPTLLSERRIAAILLIACFVIFAVGGILFTGRTIWKWPSAQTPEFLRWERGIVIAALLVNVLGFVLLEDLLRAAGDSLISRLALVTYVIGAVLIVVAETSFLSNREWATAQVVLHVILAFLAQAAFGAALLRTGLVPAWAGWTTIVWNVAWLALFAILRPADIYYPALHHVAPLVIGIVLLIGR